MNSVPQKIIFIGPAYPYRGGIASFNQRMAEEFFKSGHSVKIFTFKYQYPTFLFPGTTQFSAGPNPTSVPIQREIHSINPLNWIQVGSRIKKEKPDLVICNFWLPLMAPCFGTILRLAKKNNHTKILSIIHNIVPHEKRPFDRQMAQYYANSVDAFIVMSESVRSDLKYFFKNQKVNLIPHPIYDNYGQPVSKMESALKLELDPDFRYILFFGFIRRYKGLDLLIEAMDHAFFVENRIHLLIAGEYYDNKMYYQEKISELKEPSVILEHTFFIPDEQVKYYFGLSDLVVQPYRSATQSGISQLAIFFEKPMIVTAVGGLPEIIGHKKGGYVVDTNPHAIQQAIIRYFSENKQEQFVSHIKNQKKIYSWKNLYSGIIDLVS